MSEQINIRAAYIHGVVGFAALNQNLIPPDVEVEARHDRNKVNTRVSGSAGQATRYCLVVEPGQWKVFAKCGALISQSKEVSLNSGQSFELNFVFGC